MSQDKKKPGEVGYIAEGGKPGIQSTPGGSLTQQHFKDDADINKRVESHFRSQTGKRKTLRGIGSPNGERSPFYFQMASADYQTMVNKVMDMKSAFMRLSGKMRAKFNNDPHQLLRFVEDPANYNECVKQGWIIDPDVKEALDAEQMDLEKQAKVAGESSVALKPDPEANPNYKPPEGAKKGS